MLLPSVSRSKFQAVEVAVLLARKDVKLSKEVPDTLRLGSSKGKEGEGIGRYEE
jgi:hypothetical protein